MNAGVNVSTPQASPPRIQASQLQNVSPLQSASQASQPRDFQDFDSLDFEI